MLLALQVYSYLEITIPANNLKHLAFWQELTSFCVLLFSNLMEQDGPAFKVINKIFTYQLYIQGVCCPWGHVERRAMFKVKKLLKVWQFLRQLVPQPVLQLANHNVYFFKIRSNRFSQHVFVPSSMVLKEVWSI